MHVKDYSQMIGWITRDKTTDVPGSMAHEARIMDQAALVDDVVPGRLKDELAGNFDPSQETYEEYLQRINLERPFNMNQGGRIGFKYGEGVQQIIKNSVGSPYGEGYHIMDYYSKEDAVPAKGGRGGKTRNLYVKTYDEAKAALEKKPLRKSKAGIKLTKAEAAKIKKILEANGKGAGIYEYGGKGSGKYEIKIKVEKAGKKIWKNFTYTGDDSLKNALDYHTEARAKLFPNQISDAKFKELRLLNSNLTDAQFANLLNESNYLTSKGNPFNATTAFNWKRRLDLGSLGPRTFRTIEEAEKVVREKFGKNFKQIFKNDSEIFAKATQLINDKEKWKGKFPRGASSEDFLWHSFSRAASQGSQQISYDLSALGYELPMENGKVNWSKKINGIPAWKLVKFKDNDVGKTFSYNEKNGKHIIGDLKNQVNTAYKNPNKFNNAVKGFYEQAEIGQKFSGRLRDDFLLKELEAKLGRKITKADSELVDNWLASRRPGFSLTQVHHPEGIAKNVYNTQNVFTAANLKERDLEKIRKKEVKTLGEEIAQKNYNEGLQKISDEFGGIQKKVGSRYVGTAPTKKGLVNILNGFCGSSRKKFSTAGVVDGMVCSMDEVKENIKKQTNEAGKLTKDGKIPKKFGKLRSLAQFFGWIDAPIEFMFAAPHLIAGDVEGAKRATTGGLAGWGKVDLDNISDEKAQRYLKHTQAMNDYFDNYGIAIDAENRLKDSTPGTGDYKLTTQQFENAKTNMDKIQEDYQSYGYTYQEGDTPIQGKVAAQKYIRDKVKSDFEKKIDKQATTEAFKDADPELLKENLRNLGGSPDKVTPITDLESYMRNKGEEMAGNTNLFFNVKPYVLEEAEALGVGDIFDDYALGAGVEGYGRKSLQDAYSEIPIEYANQLAALEKKQLEEGLLKKRLSKGFAGGGIASLKKKW